MVVNAWNDPLGQTIMAPYKLWLLSFRRMVRKEDLPKIFFIYLCLCHLAPAHPCGSNPLRRFRPLSRMLGRDTNSLLNLLRDSNPRLYRQVQTEWRLYADCVGLVDTGYFKRSGAAGQRPEDREGLEHSLYGRGQKAAKRFTKVDNPREEKLLALLRSVSSSQTGFAQLKRNLTLANHVLKDNSE